MRQLFLVDQNLTTQKVFRSSLAEEGIEVRSFESGDSLLSSLQTACPDIIAINVTLTGEDGYELCRRLKSAPETSHLPVFFLVGAFQPFDEARGRDAGCDNWLVKPFETTELKRVVDLLISRGKKRDEPGGGRRELFDLPISPVSGGSVFDLTPEQCSGEAVGLQREVVSGHSRVPRSPSVGFRGVPVSLTPVQAQWISERLTNRLAEELRRILPPLLTDPKFPG